MPAKEVEEADHDHDVLIQEHIDGDLICLDFSGKMHAAARERNRGLNHHYVRGIFEELPFRTEAIGFVTAAYALRDSLDKETSFSEAHRVLEGGADTDDVYNFSWFNYALLTVSYHF